MRLRHCNLVALCALACSWLSCTSSHPRTSTDDEPDAATSDGEIVDAAPPIQPAAGAGAAGAGGSDAGADGSDAGTDGSDAAADGSAGTDGDDAGQDADLDAPVAAIDFPPRVSFTDATTVSVRGRAVDTAGVASVLVNAVPATSTDGFASWSVTLPLVSGENPIVVSTRDDLGNVDSNADSVLIRRDGTPLISIRAMDVDAAHDRILIVDDEHAVVAADLSTGITSVLSDRAHGAGIDFSVIENLAVDADSDRVLVLDWGNDALIAVDLTTGNRSVVSPPSAVLETELSIASGLALDSDNQRAFVVTRGSPAVIAVDLVSGARSVISSTTVGTGTSFENPLDIAYDASSSPAAPRLLVSDAGFALPAIIAVDLATGNRSILSAMSPNGTGVALAAPIRIELDAANARLLVADTDTSRNALVAVDLVTGDRTTLADATAGSGYPLSAPFALAFDPHTDHVYVSAAGAEVVDVDLETLSRVLFSASDLGAGPKLGGPRGVLVGIPGQPDALYLCDAWLHSIFRIDLLTGDRSEVSGPAVGSGPSLDTPSDMLLDTITGGAPRVLVVDSGLDGLIGVDLATGARTVVSSASVGAGPTLSFPRNLTLDAANGRVLVTDATTNLTQSRLFEIELSTGNRSVLSGDTRGSGPNFVLPTGIVLDDRSSAASPRALVSDGQLFGLVSVSMSTGDRTIWSSNGGVGLPFELPGESVLDRGNQRVLVTDLSHANITAVDLASGDRVIVSGSNTVTPNVIGTGPELGFPWSITADFERNVAYVVDSDRSAVLAVDLVSGDRVVISR